MCFHVISGKSHRSGRKFFERKLEDGTLFWGKTGRREATVSTPFPSAFCIVPRWMEPSFFHRLGDLQFLAGLQKFSHWITVWAFLKSIIMRVCGLSKPNTL
jgi:hypothetical protein